MNTEIVKYNKIIFLNVSNILNILNKNCSGVCPVSSKYFTGTFEVKDEFCYIGV